MADSSMPEIRLSDAERDDVINQLSAAMGEGRLDVSEFEQRSRLVYAAKIRSDLDGVLADLPVESTPTRAPAPDKRQDHRWFVSLLGDRTNRGNLSMGKSNSSISVLGDTTFDLTEVEAAEIDLRIFSALGDVTVLVRPGTELISNVFLALGDRTDDLPGPLAPNAMRVQLRVIALLGDVKVRVQNV